MTAARRLLPLCLLLCAAGCGMYGSLYLEEEPPVPPAAAEMPDEDRDDAAADE